MLPLYRSRLPIILTLCAFLVLSDHVEHAEHLGLALVDPFIEQKVGDFHVFSLVLEASNHHHIQEVNPVGDALNQLVLLSYIFVLLEDALLGLLQDIGQAVDLQILAIQHMYDLLHIKLILFLTAYIFVLGVCSRRILEAQFLQFLFQFHISLLAGMKHEDLQKDKQQVNDRIGVAKQIVLRQWFPGYEISLLANSAFEVLEVSVVANEDHMCYQDMEQFLLDFGVDENLIGNVGQCALFVDIPDEPILRDERVDRAQRDHVLSLKLSPAAHTFLVCFFVSHLGQVLDQRDEYILGVVFLEFYLGLGGLADVLLRWWKELEGAGEFDLLRLVDNATLFLCGHVNLNYISCKMLVSAFGGLEGKRREGGENEGVLEWVGAGTKMAEIGSLDFWGFPSFRCWFFCSKLSQSI